VNRSKLTSYKITDSQKNVTNSKSAKTVVCQQRFIVHNNPNPNRVSQPAPAHSKKQHIATQLISAHASQGKGLGLSRETRSSRTSVRRAILGDNNTIKGSHD
jgi:hypothetical protein